MDRAEAEAIYDAGRDVCVEFMLELAARVGQLEDRLRRLEEPVASVNNVVELQPGVAVRAELNG